jgi:hypothetical protein
LTLATNKTENLMCNWHVPEKPSLSDDRYIFFKTGNIIIIEITFTDPTRTNCESYRQPKSKS